MTVPAAAVVAPDGLLAPWRSLPRLAGHLARAFAPPGARPGWLRGVFGVLWLPGAAALRMTGRLMAVGSAALVLHQPRRGARRVLRDTVLAGVLFTGGLATAVLAGAAAPLLPLPLLVLVLAVVLVAVVLLLWQSASLARSARAGTRLRRVASLLAAGGACAEVSTLAGGRDGQETRDLVQAVIVWADDNQVVLVAAAADARLARLYGRAGFEPHSPASPVLVRRPRPAGSPWRPAP